MNQNILFKLIYAVQYHTDLINSQKSEWVSSNCDWKVGVSGSKVIPFMLFYIKKIT